MPRRDKPNPASIAKREDKDRIVALVSQGWQPHEAVRSIGRNIQTYERWRREDKAWARRLTELRLARDDTQGFQSVDLIEFRKTYFGHDTPPHHLRMFEAVESQKPGSMDLILGFPQCAKTTAFVDRVNHKLGPVDPNYRIAIISEGQDLARKILGQIKDRMTEEALFRPYIDRYGPFRAPDRELNRPWNADYITVLQASNDEKDYSLESRGAGSTLYGGRFDWIWFDDIQSDRNIEATDKLLRYIRQTALTRPDLDRGYITLTGSRVGPTDIYAKMIDEEVVDRVVTIPVLDRWVDRDDHFEVRYDRSGAKHVRANPDCEAKPTWDRFTMQRLAEIRQKVGEEIWSRTYMQRSFDSSAATFTEAMIEDAKDRTRTAGLDAVGTDIICTVDPAFDSGYCAFTALALSPNRLWILDSYVRGDVTRYEDIYEEMRAWSASYKPSRWIIEQNNFQKGLIESEAIRALAENFHFKVHGHQTGRNKNDPVIGVGMMASSFIDGEISIPWGDDETARRMSGLTDELRTWRPGVRGAKLRQDRVMGLWFGWFQWQKERKIERLGGRTDTWNVGGMPISPTGYRPMAGVA